MERIARIDQLESRKLLAATTLDTGFNLSGIVTSGLNGGYNNLNVVAVQPDGKVIVAGNGKIAVGGAYGFAAIRYNADGTLDDGTANDSTPGDSFGVGGKFFYVEGLTASVTAIAIQKDGKIILAGPADSNGSMPQQYWLVTRLNANGSFDKTFNGNGRFGIQFSIYNTPLTAIALQSDGKIVVAGSLNGDFLVGRFNADGTEDDAFGDFGTTTADFGGTDEATGVAIDYLGRILVVGGTGGNGVKQDIGVARLLSNGTLDTAYGNGGLAHNSDRSNYQSLETYNATVDSQGRVIVAVSGYSSTYSEWISGTTSFAADGDSSGGGGVEKKKVTALVQLPNGVVATAGIDLGSQQNHSDLYVNINNNTRTPALGFANATKATAIAVGPDGSVYVGGYVDRSGARDFLLTKFEGLDLNSFGAISGNIYRDSDGDLVKDGNEPGLSNVRVYIDEDNDGKYNAHTLDLEPTTFTDLAGNYRFIGFDPDNYVVRQVLPAKYTQEIPASSYSVAVIGGRTAGGRNFADKPFIIPSTATAITGNVFNDYNNNATRQTTGTIEPDMTGVVVYIDANRNGKYELTETYAKTDVSGNYTLALPKAGTWRVVVSPPRGYTGSAPIFRDILVHSHTQGVARFALTPLDVSDTLTEAAALTLGRTVTGNIANATDVNFYSLTVKAGQTILFDLDLGSGSSLNSYLRVFDSRGTQITANDNAAASGEVISLDSYIRYRFSKAGTYYVGVSNHLNNKYSPLTGKDDVGGGSIGAYSLLARALA